ncbi:UNVERIFIED_CONTAM: hypothetical protein Sangu_1443300 [Sesamum angustifolium]|uniref:Uncharacterized protein n=1 Tax=Sesamum angustifolium TaxID=2727405 RepID=A0AAW2N5E4_9LAMI
MGRKFIYLLPTFENSSLKQQDPRLVEPNDLEADSSHRLDLSKSRQYVELTSPRSDASRQTRVTPMPRVP